MPLDTLPSLTIADDLWEPIGEGDDIRARLLAQCMVCGVMMHAEAFEIEAGSDPQYPVADAISEDAWDTLTDGFGADGPFETCTIAGREYVVLISPHCD